MKKIFVLSKDNLDIAKEEVLVLSHPKSHEQFDDLIVLDTEVERLQNRLAFTHKILDHIFTCKENELLDKIDSFDWNSIYQENFKVVVHCAENRCVELADKIWDKLKRPKVDLKYARTVIEFFFKEDKIVCGVLDRNVKKDFLKRKSHLLPESHPTSMDPKLAKALVNISKAETGDSIIDPFCGAGGLLLEAGLMRFKTLGWDIDKIMIKRAKINLEHFQVKRFHLEHRDALSIDKKYDVLITDLPYGKNSKTGGKKIDELYKKFLEKYYDYINKKMVVVFPDFFDYKTLIKKSKWKIEREFESYLHKSLTKKIVILVK